MTNSVCTPWGIIGNERGLTLIELMIVLVLSLFLMAAVYMTFQVQRKTGDVQQEVSSLQQDVRAVMDIMAKDVRQAGCDPLRTGTPGLVNTQCGPSSMEFTMDLNDDGDTTDANEHVRYAYATPDLTRTADGVTVDLSSRMTSFGLTYYNGNNTVITPHGSGSMLLQAEADNVRSVEIRITMQSQKRDPDLNDFIRRSMSRHLKMRNLGL
jgi:prepilin-type N-terminal cleavage/methylation domain-containing protein